MDKVKMMVQTNKTDDPAIKEAHIQINIKFIADNELEIVQDVRKLIAKFEFNK